MDSIQIDPERIYTTVGVYNNDDYKVNGVKGEHLEGHIEYNKKYRPGRALFVEGKCVHGGYLTHWRALEWEKKIPVIIRKRNKCTAPYH